MGPLGAQLVGDKKPNEMEPGWGLSNTPCVHVLPTNVGLHITRLGWVEVLLAAATGPPNCDSRVNS